MKSYEIKIEVEANGRYLAKDKKEAQETAEAIALNIYNRLDGCYSVNVESVEEVK